MFKIKQFLLTFFILIFLCSGIYSLSFGDTIPVNDFIKMDLNKYDFGFKQTEFNIINNSFIWKIESIILSQNVLNSVWDKSVNVNKNVKIYSFPILIYYDCIERFDKIKCSNMVLNTIRKRVNFFERTERIKYENWKNEIISGKQINEDIKHVFG